jgi:hypothetical protein
MPKFKFDMFGNLLQGDIFYYWYFGEVVKYMKIDYCSAQCLDILPDLYRGENMYDKFYAFSSIDPVSKDKQALEAFNNHVNKWKEQINGK